MSVWLCFKFIFHNVSFFNSNLQITLAKDIVNVYRVSKGESMTVFVVQEVVGKNILSAEKYGDLELLLPEGSQLVLSTAPTVRRLKSKLKDFSDDDYLLLMGDPSAIGIACAVASSNNRGRFKCLKWDKREYKYYPVEVNLYEKGEIDE
jgi:hypothetical protein